MDNYLLGQFVKEKRNEMKMSLRDFGKQCGISHTTIDTIEKGYDPRNGKPANITNTTFEKLSQGLGVPMTTLVALSKGIDTTAETKQAGLRETRYDELTDKNKELIDQMIEMLLKSQFAD